jgi:hypothetical protein
MLNSINQRYMYVELKVGWDAKHCSWIFDKNIFFNLESFMKFISGYKVLDIFQSIIV